jgi:acyl-CoA synthetase (AMP-forming)/AMP-acid ligase II
MTPTGADSFTSVLLTPNEPDMDPTAKPELSAGPSRSLHQPFEAHSAQFIYFTSGSTGKPKGVVISGESVTNNAKFLGFRKGISGGLDVGAVTQPFSHVGGLVVNMLSQMMHGVTNVLPAPSFDPRATLAAVQEEVRPKLTPNHNACRMLSPCARTVLHEAPLSFELTDIHLCCAVHSRAPFWMAFPVNSQSTSTSQIYSDMTLPHSARVLLVLQPFLRN